MTESMKGVRMVLFKNERKETERHPDYRGTANFPPELGGDHFLSAWINTAKGSGKKYLSLVVGDVKEVQPELEIPPAETDPFTEDVAPAEDFDDDIPF